MIKAVLFDYGGVLSPGGKNVKAVFGQLLNLPPDQFDIDDIGDQLRRGTISTSDFFAQLSQRFGKTYTFADFQKHSDIYSKNQAVYELAKQLRQQGIKTGILSNMYEDSAERLSRESYYEGFDPVILSCEENLAKPDPRFYDLAVKRVGCRPNEIIFIDDQDRCLPPALAMGMKVIKAVTPEQIVRDVTELLRQENGLQL